VAARTIGAAGVTFLGDLEYPIEVVRSIATYWCPA
jgi:hypothetical protein